MRRAVAALLAATFLATPAAAQWRVGGFLGGEHESSWDEFLVLGADARGTVGAKGLELNPRLSYFLREGTTRVQVDVNLIKPLVLAERARLAPYVGAGVALQRVSFDAPTIDDETSVGVNYIAGATTSGRGRMKPFAQFQYTVLHDALNNAVVSVGLHFALGGGASASGSMPTGAAARR